MTVIHNTGLRHMLAALLLGGLLTGCGGSSGNTDVIAGSSNPPPDSSACSSDCGTLLVGLTDADGDFLEYSVAVTALSLERADGARVNIMPQSAVVDFAQYTELTEFLTAATVPPGTYVAAEITLDYATAEVFVELNDEPAAAVLTDADGQAPGTETIRLGLADGNRLTIAPGLPSVMLVDFDLAASHELDLTTVPVTAVARPFLVADIDPIDMKEMRLRGPLVSVNLEDTHYVVAVRPFWLWHGDFGRVRVHTTDDTAFEIDGTSYAGDAGLRALAELDPGTATLAYGKLDVPGRHFTASEVYAGSSVPGHAADVVKGVIAARSGDELTVHGATLIRERDSVIFRGEITVTVGPETTVRKAGDSSFDGGAGALSVGQRLTAFGRLVSPGPDRLMLDATTGHVRMMRTVLAGTVNRIDAGQINVDLQKLAGANIRRFDFSGTGLPGEDADPDDYEVDTAAVDTSEIALQSPVKASGFVSAFGTAPPDFNATTVADFSAAHALLSMGWNPATATPFLTIGAEGLTIDLHNPDIGHRHHLVRAGIVTDLTTLDRAAVLPAADHPGLFGIRQGRTIQLYRDYDEFTRDLSARLGGGATASGMYATGRWSDATGELTARRILVALD